MRIKLSSLCFFVVSSLICSFGNANAASSLEDQEKALNVIADFADRICSNIRLEGSGSAVELNGEAKAELKGLLKKFANLGIGGTGKYEETAWSGVLQKDIATILQKNADCKLKIVDLLKDKITSTNHEDYTPHAENKDEDKKISSGNDLKTVEECFNEAQKIDKRKVRVQGKVVKFTASILNRNWLHLQDGSGDQENNTHDLVVTTLEQVKNGTTVVVEGILSREKDFGAGYRYAAIIEDAKILPVR